MAQTIKMHIDAMEIRIPRTMLLAQEAAAGFRLPFPPFKAEFGAA
ncbi:hypothetical protein COLO4_27565 [Corchorus olitorius]|uniref:Uncharacterized protein n=1 Tax=Corchorus olitorius TaxID=93759 RepID=A0A1R3HQN1_9ROSI|nr:hypothetical protein COLO4_27565 [Corchorus olitorius]